MARYTGPVCKLCRREGDKLFLKSTRCFSEKCAFNRRPFPPGEQHRGMRRKPSDYSIQLREKQKVKRIYGVLEKQFRLTFKRASLLAGRTGDNLMALLELRLDNFVYRCGFAPSRRAARQLVNHGHFTVNGRKVDIPSFVLRPGETVKVREISKQMEIIHQELKRKSFEDATWYEVDKSSLSGKVLERPTRDKIPTPCNEQLIVELYSK